jgi:Protein kinase domain/Leucine rich repeat
MHTLKQLQSGALQGTTRLDLSCNLTAVPPEVFGLADTLEVLNLSGNQLKHLPPDLPRLHRLKVIFCSDNHFTELPEVLGQCESLQIIGFKANRIATVRGAALPPALRWLILTDNAITQLPVALGQRPALQKLMLAGNQLSSVPDSLANATRLELVRLSANALTKVPAWLPTLPRLSWLALAGNPLGWHRPAPAALPAVTWAQLKIQGLLGQGASGHIYRVQHADGPDCALKVFKGAMTSDGLPEHELAACSAAGQQAALCTPSAVVPDHPQGAQAFLLPLIPSTYINLAGPPSLESCTRDVYPAGLRIPAANVLRMARCIATALAHLHQRGVLHGDVYAHNIMWNPANGDALLSDFGAATLLPLDQPDVCRALMALEVRAFGCLLEELLAHAQPEQRSPTLESDRVECDRALRKLGALAQNCLLDDPSLRPSMDEVLLQIL